MEALLEMRVLVLVDFCDLLDLEETGILATFWDDIGVTEDKVMPGFVVVAVL